MNLKQFITDNTGHAHQRALKEFYWQLIMDALELSGGNQTEASKMLGMCRTTFRKYCDIYEVDYEHRTNTSK